MMIKLPQQFKAYRKTDYNTALPFACQATLAGEGLVLTVNKPASHQNYMFCKVFIVFVMQFYTCNLRHYPLT